MKYTLINLSSFVSPTAGAWTHQPNPSFTVPKPQENIEMNHKSSFSFFKATELSYNKTGDIQMQANCTIL